MKEAKTISACLDPINAITATVVPTNYPHGRRAVVSTLASPNITDENSREKPDAVVIKQQTVDVGRGSFDPTFPKHSVTAIKLSPR